MVPGRGTWVRLGSLALLIFVFGQIVYWKFVIGPVGSPSRREPTTTDDSASRRILTRPETRLQ